MDRKRKINLDSADDVKKSRFDMKAEDAASYVVNCSKQQGSSVALEAILGHNNPLTGKPFSANYAKILQGRRNLPVYQFIGDLEATLRENQVLVVEGKLVVHVCFFA